MEYLVNALYIVAFSMFIYGLMGLTGPKTAVPRQPDSPRSACSSPSLQL